MDFYCDALMYFHSGVDNRIHLGQEPLAPRDFALPIPPQRCKRPLITHLLSSTPADPTNYLYPNRNTYAELP